MSTNMFLLVAVVVKVKGLILDIFVVKCEVNVNEFVDSYTLTQ